MLYLALFIVFQNFFGAHINASAAADVKAGSEHAHSKQAEETITASMNGSLSGISLQRSDGKLNLCIACLPTRTVYSMSHTALNGERTLKNNVSVEDKKKFEDIKKAVEGFNAMNGIVGEVGVQHYYTILPLFKGYLITKANPPKKPVHKSISTTIEISDQQTIIHRTYSLDSYVRRFWFPIGEFNEYMNSPNSVSNCPLNLYLRLVQQYDEARKTVAKKYSVRSYLIDHLNNDQISTMFTLKPQIRIHIERPPQAVKFHL